jgi:3-keto-disaccharide hydrolase
MSRTMQRKCGNAFWILLVGCLACSSGALTDTLMVEKEVSTGANGVGPLLGRWDLTLKAPGRDYASWIEIPREKGQLKAQMVGRWGNARPLPKIEFTNGWLEFVSPKEEEERPDDMVFKGKLTGAKLSGSTTGPDGKVWQWTGSRAPSLKRASLPEWAEPIQLFNGKDLTGWTFDNPKRASSWKVANGTLVNAGAGSNLVTRERFEDFKFHVEFNCPAQANSGVYMRGRYEVQVEDDSLSEPPSHHMGAVYGFLAPSPEMPRKPGEWQSFDITLVGRMITVVQNGKTIIDNREIPGITGGALDSHEELPGPFYLQGDHGGIAYRNIVVMPAKK